MASRLILRMPITRPPLNPHPTTFTRNLTFTSRQQAKRRLQPLTRSPPPTSKSQPPRLPNPQSPNSTPKTFNDIFSERKLPLIGAGIVALLLGTYLSIVITSTLKSSSSSSSEPCSHDHISAQKFDSRLDLPERLGGITSLRRQLASEARGHVLEIAIGTGRNLPYYDWTEVVSPSSHLSDGERVKKVLNWPQRKYGTQISDLEKEHGGLEGEVISYTGVDISPDMLLLARDRVRLNVPGLAKIMRKRRAEPMPEEKPATVVSAVEDRVKLVLSDAEKLPIPPPPSTLESEKYDTILQTFGLCSVEDPKRLLKNMLKAVKPGTGKILLLEHGRGWFDWMNGLLDKWAPAHHAKYGCWWNRDIEGIVREVEGEMGGKVEIKRLKRPAWRQFGTVMLVELRVKGEGEGEEKREEKKEEKKGENKGEKKEK
ncbi:S-adenosyl-L-methionine-dependent methyltransferase [Podospora fimiseda]|uniref:S-adenosyl-L-methionine-dependent methyltransferase n=1 Tax=Podospora fimiseda TaxID=252190 RepID=A0AAN7BTW0_9PEZI|nr:S-adenosyl-L-methionine-dependent methyltransferase [Podospora fimiseda]